MAAEPIHGCSTIPKGMKTPAKGRTTFAPQPRGESKERAHHEMLRRVAQKPMCPQASEAGSGGAMRGLGSPSPSALTFLSPSTAASPISGDTPGEQGMSGT